MYTFLHTKFSSNIKRYVKKYNNLLLTVSSGQDSLCLLKLFSDYLEKDKFNIQAIYIDHQWKNDSMNHTQHIINLMKTINIPIAIYQIKYLALSENTARQLRYKIFIEHAIKKRCKTIITGHNNYDQIETFLHNILRGTSLNGFTSLIMYKRINSKISILRPLINFSKPEISWFCRLFYLPIWSDITNYNLSITRNRVRHELIPYLASYFNPKIHNNLTKFINFCQHDNEYIQENTLKLYIHSTHKTIISLNLEKLHLQHKILQKRVIKLFFFYHFRKQINTYLIHQIWRLYKFKKRGLIFFSQLKIYYNYGWIYIGHS